MKLNEKKCKHIMQHIVKFGLTKASISSNLYTAVKYGIRSLVGIGPFDLFVIQGTFRIYFLIKKILKVNSIYPTTLGQPIHSLNGSGDRRAHIRKKLYLKYPGLCL